MDRGGAAAGRRLTGGDVRVRRVTLVALGGIAALFAAQYAWVLPTNFSGYDEWLYLSLTSRGIISYPYENRPVVYLWHLPPSLLWPHSLNAYYTAHGLYLLLIGWLTYALARRLAPGSIPFAFMAGALAAIWAPGDHARLNTLGLTSYSGHTLGTFIAIALFVESWIRRRPLLLVAGMVAAMVSARGTEVAVPVLAGAPLLLYFLTPGAARRRGQWIVAWELVVVVAGILAIWPVIFPPATGSRQHALGLDPAPLAVLGRLLLQFSSHLAPLVTSPPRELAHAAVALSAAIAWMAFRLIASPAPDAGDAPSRRRLLEILALGMVFAALAYFAFSLTGSLALPVRTQFFAAPGIALALTATAFLGMSHVPARFRQLVGAAVLAWAASVAMGRTLAMQADWSSWGTYPAQSAVLRQIVALAPDLEPHTLVLLVSDRLPFKASYTFRHAVGYLYQERAVGLAWGASDFLYPSRIGNDGVTIEPMPVIRGPWRSPPTLHRYDEIVVFQEDALGRLVVPDHWPSGLPPLPPGASYDPRARIRPAERAIPERGILRP